MRFTANAFSNFRRTWIVPAFRGGCIAATSDLTCQWYMGNMKQQDNIDDHSFDVRRAGSFAAFTFAYAGFFQRIVYKRYDMWFATSLQKVAADCLLHAPLLYIPAFQITTGLLQGKPLEECIAKHRASYVETLCAYFLIWPFPMIAIFSYVPEPSRLLALCCMGFVEKMVYSWIQQKRFTTSAGYESVMIGSMHEELQIKPDIDSIADLLCKVQIS